jgi:hypothetical protein
MMVRVAAERDALALGGQDVPDAGGDDMVEVADGGSDGDEENEWGVTTAATTMKTTPMTMWIVRSIKYVYRRMRLQRVSV